MAQIEDMKDVKRERQKFKKSLKELSNSVSIYLYKIDELFMRNKDVPRGVSEKIAKLSNELDMANDRVKHFNLNLSINASGKKKYVDKLLGNIHEDTNNGA